MDSHELRTPMACIIGLLDMLLMENLTVEHEGSIRQIHRCATSLVSLLNSALDIAKVWSSISLIQPPVWPSFFNCVFLVRMFCHLVICTEVWRLKLESRKPEKVWRIIEEVCWSANDTCVFKQVESGKLVLEKAEFNLEAELTALIDVFSVQCDNKNLFISLDVAG